MSKGRRRQASKARILRLELERALFWIRLGAGEPPRVV